MRDTVIYNQNFKTGERFEEHIQKNGILTKIEVDVIDNKTGEVIESAYTENDINYRIFNEYHPGYRALINNVKMDTVQKINVGDDYMSGRIELWNSDDISPEQQVFNRHLIGWAGKETTYSGNSIKQGTYNNVESIKDGKRQLSTYVYDWPTHAANGTFNTICYTPNASDWLTMSLGGGTYFKEKKTYYVPFESQSGCTVNGGLSCLINASEGKLDELGGCPHLILDDEAYYFLWNGNNREYLSFKKYNFKTNSEVTVTKISADINVEYTNFKVAYDYSDDYVYIMFYNSYFSESSKIDIYRIDLINGATDAILVASPVLRNCLAPENGSAYTYTCDSYIHQIDWFNGLCKAYYRYGEGKGSAEVIFDPFTETLLDYYYGDSEKWRYIKKLGKITTFNNVHIFNMNTLKIEEYMISMNVRAHYNDTNYTQGYIENNRNTIIQWDLNSIGGIPRNSVTEFLYAGVFSLAKLSKPVTKTPDNTLKVKYTFQIEKVYQDKPNLLFKGDTVNIVDKKASVETYQAALATESFSGITKEQNILKPLIKDELINSSIDSASYSRYTLTKEDAISQNFIYNNQRRGVNVVTGNAPGVDVSSALSRMDSNEGPFINSQNREGFYVLMETKKADTITLRIRCFMHNYGGAGEASIHVTNTPIPPAVSSDVGRVYYKNSNGAHTDETVYVQAQLQPGKNYIHFRNSVLTGYHHLTLYDVFLTKEYDNTARQNKAILINSEGKLIKRSFQNAGYTLKEFNTRYIRWTVDGYTATKTWNTCMNTFYAKVGSTNVALNKPVYTYTEDDDELFPFIKKVTDGIDEETQLNGIDSVVIDLKQEYNLDAIRAMLHSNGEAAYAKLEVSNDLINWYIIKHCDDQTYPCNLAEQPGTTPLRAYVWTTQDITTLEADLASYGTMMMAYDAKNYLSSTGNKMVDIFRFGQYGMISDIRYAKEQIITFNNYTAPSQKTISGFSLNTTCHPRSIYYVVSFDNGKTWKTISNSAFIDTDASYQSIHDNGIQYAQKRKFEDAIRALETKPTQIKVKMILKNVVYNVRKEIKEISYLTV